MLVKLSNNTISEVELRDHLLQHCIASSHSCEIIREERRRAGRPVVRIHHMEGWSRAEAEHWL